MAKLATPLCSRFLSHPSRRTPTKPCSGATWVFRGKPMQNTNPTRPPSANPTVRLPFWTCLAPMIQVSHVEPATMRKLHRLPCPLDGPLRTGKVPCLLADGPSHAFLRRWCERPWWVRQVLSLDLKTHFSSSKRLSHGHLPMISVAGTIVAKSRSLTVAFVGAPIVTPVTFCVTAHLSFVWRASSRSSQTDPQLFTF